MPAFRYKITRGPDQTFKVAISQGSILYGAAGFKSESDATAWVNRKKRQAKGGQREAPQPDTGDEPISA